MFLVRRSRTVLSLLCLALGITLATGWLSIVPQSGVAAQTLDKTAPPTADQILERYEQALGAPWRSPR
jgi:hypothetical protein